MSALIKFLKSEDGPTAVEYAVVIGLILLVVMVSVQLLQTKTGVVYNKVGTELQNAGF